MTTIIMNYEVNMFVCHQIKQVRVCQAGVPGWIKEHRQHTDGQSPAGVPQFRSVGFERAMSFLSL